MPLEIEQKFRVDSHDPIRERAIALGAKPLGVVEQSDQYFAHPSRDFRATGEALRVRRSGDSAVITYKGPKLDTQVKTRPEIELPVGGDGIQFSDLLELLSFTPVAKVHKQRERYRVDAAGRALEIALDNVQGVGLFVEIEAIAEEAEMNQAKAAVVGLADQLGLDQLEPRSYLRMLLESN